MHLWLGSIKLGRGVVTCYGRRVLVIVARESVIINRDVSLNQNTWETVMECQAVMDDFVTQIFVILSRINYVTARYLH